MTGVFQIRPRGGLLYALSSRLRDIVLVLMALPLLLPLIGLSAAAAKRSSRSTALFKHTRVGRGGDFFELLKIRTLYAHTSPQVSKQETTDMATPVGRFLREHKWDEFPQLWNVLKGDMSLVGPRPIIPEEYQGSSHYQRLAVRPGVTGLWQLSRVRELPFDRNPEYDLFYLSNRSLAFDFWLIWRTLLLLLLGKQTKIRMAVARWERDTSWRDLVPDRSRAIPRRTGPLLSRLASLTFVAFVAILAAPSVFQGLSSRSDFLNARRNMISARQALFSLETDNASRALDRADEGFKRAHDRLTSWMTLPGRMIPLVRGNLEVATALASGGRDMVASGRQALQVLNSLPSEEGRVAPPWREGTLDLKPFLHAAKPAGRLKSLVSRAHSRVQSSDGVLLLPPIRAARGEALRLLAQAKREADIAAGVAELIPKAFGRDGKRTWLIGAENTAELRGRGGYIGSLGVIEVEQGRMTLGGFTPTVDLPPLKVPSERGVPPEYGRHYWRLAGLAAWQNLTMSPNFPSGARLLLEGLKASGGPVAEGLITMDPTALSYLLKVAGPVEVPEIPHPITADNVVRWSLNEAYAQFEDSDERRRGLGIVAERTWNELLSSHDVDPVQLADAVGRALRERRIVLYSTDPREQEVIERLNIDGRVDEARADYFLVVGQNLGENKMDYYLRRKVSYEGRLNADGSLNSSLEVTIHNSADPNSQLPAYIGGSRSRIGVSPGTARTYLSVFVPSSAILHEVLLDGRRTENFGTVRELGKNVYVMSLDLAPQESRRVSFKYLNRSVLSAGRYELQVQNQATVHPDSVSVRIKLPPRTSLMNRQGFFRGDQLVWQGALRGDRGFTADVHIGRFDQMVAKLASALRRPIS